MLRMLLLGAWQMPCCGYWQAPCGLALSRALLNCIAYLSHQRSTRFLLRSKKILLQICMQTELALNFQTHSNLHYPSALEPTWRTAIIQNQFVNLVFPLPFSAGRKCSPKARRLSSHSVACFHKPAQLHASPQSQHQVSFCATFNSDCGGEERKRKCLDSTLENICDLKSLFRLEK